MLSRKSASKIALVFGILFLCFPGVMAQYVSFADPDSTVHKDILVYNSTGSLIGSYNTTSTLIDLTGAGDVIFVMKPEYTNPLEDPSAFLSSLMGWAGTNALSLLILCMLIGLAFKRF
jgi:ABC-type sugar transport system permease subunit